jgi:protein-S-isoprenylcysteine O-methyltransferase Ste14
MSDPQAQTIAPPVSASASAALFRAAYRLFAYFGLFSLAAVVLVGFRYDATASPIGYGWNAALYAAFIIPHLIMTRSWFKRAVWHNPAGTPGERRVYITITVLTWLAIIAVHQPMPGPAIAVHYVVRFIGVVVFLIGFMMFFEGVTRPMLDGLVGVPGSVGAYSHGPESPLFTEGQYAEVRHPMYRAFILMGLASLLVHPNVAQLFWVALFGGTFLAFIPVEEAQMIRARGEDYRSYMSQTRWRLVRGIW